MPRLLSLLPSATEIIYDIGAGDSLVGVTHECDYPAATAALPRVTGARIDASIPSDEIDRLVREQLDESGSLYTLDMDLVRELRPTHVLTQQLCTVCAVGYSTVRAAMRSLPEPPEVINLEPRTLDEVFATLVDVGELCGRADAARERVRIHRDRLASFAGANGSRRPRVLFLEWLIPPFSAGHWMAELVDAAGGEPVLADRGAHSHQLSWPAIAEAADAEAPIDVLVISCCGFSVERTLADVEASAELAALTTAHPALRVLVFDGNHFFSRPGPRLVESAELLHHALAGRAPDEVVSTIARPWAEEILGLRS